MFGVRSFEAVINPPQAAILSVGALEPRPVVRDGEVVVRQQMDVELACDHRILYGAAGRRVPRARARDPRGAAGARALSQRSASASSARPSRS